MNCRRLKAFFPIILVIGALAIGLSCTPIPPDPIHEPVSEAAIRRGLSLTHGLAACGSCHAMGAKPGAPLVGGSSWFDVYGEVTASNLTPVSLGKYSTQELVRIMRGGIRPNQSELSPDVHRGYEWMSDEDLISVIAYLRSLTPQGDDHGQREIGTVARNTTGFFETRREVRGYVPAISRAHPLAYGKYLVDAVARCGFCHTTPAGYFTDSNYLAGGRTIRTDKGEKIAPALLNSQVYGIGEWTADQIVRFLKTGITPDQRAVDPDFCPVSFFARGDDDELSLLARYLKSLRQ